MTIDPSTAPPLPHLLKGSSKRNQCSGATSGGAFKFATPLSSNVELSSVEKECRLAFRESLIHVVEKDEPRLSCF